MISSAITAFFEMLKQFFATKQTGIQECTTTEIVKEKKQLKKASDITENILDITDKYYNLFDKKDKRRYTLLKKKFKRSN